MQSCNYVQLRIVACKARGYGFFKILFDHEFGLSGPRDNLSVPTMENFWKFFGNLWNDFEILNYFQSEKCQRFWELLKKLLWKFFYLAVKAFFKCLFMNLRVLWWWRSGFRKNEIVHYKLLNYIRCMIFLLNSYFDWFKLHFI